MLNASLQTDLNKDAVEAFVHALQIVPREQDAINERKWALQVNEARVVSKSFYRVMAFAATSNLLTPATQNHFYRKLNEHATLIQPYDDAMKQEKYEYMKQKGQLAVQEDFFQEMHQVHMASSLDEITLWRYLKSRFRMLFH